jgi:hypothetical protein
MRNVKMARKGNVLVIEVDLAQRLGRSATGKTTIVATTSGNVGVPSSGGDDPHAGVKVGINVYDAAPPA